MLIDTHAHLYAEQFDEDRGEMMKRAFDSGVQKIYLPNIDKDSIEPMLALEAAYPDNCFAMMGLHPCYVKDDVEVQLKIVEEWLEKRSFCAIGEIGIDLYWDKTFFDAQKMAFERQIDWAISLNIPIVIHSRESTEEVIAILKAKQNPKLRGIFHCFSGTAEQAKEIVDLGFYLGIGGVLTFKKSTLGDAIKDISLDHLVLETDAPYLSPTPYRGKRNESAYIEHITTHLAGLKKLSFDEIAEKTTINALKIFENHKK